MIETTRDRQPIVGYGAEGAEMLTAAFVQAHWEEFAAWLREQHGDESACRGWVEGRDAVTAALLTEYSRIAVTAGGGSAL